MSTENRLSGKKKETAPNRRGKIMVEKVNHQYWILNFALSFLPQTITAHMNRDKNKKEAKKGIW